MPHHGRIAVALLLAALLVSLLLPLAGCGALQDEQRQMDMLRLGKRIINFRARHGQYPASLQMLASAEQLTAPERDLIEKDAVAYVPPASAVVPSGYVLLYESYQAWPRFGVFVIFADGSAQTFADEQEFLEVLQSTRDFNQRHSGLSETDPQDDTGQTDDATGQSPPESYHPYPPEER